MSRAFHRNRCLGHYQYGPFGELLRATGPLSKANPFRFSTKYRDDETDLLYYGYRYCNASVDRWLSRDPKAERGGRNLYGFVRNDPISDFDPLGLCGGGGTNPGERAICGDDVTFLVYSGLLRISTEYNLAPTWKQELACANMFANPITGWDAWDMRWLKYYGSWSGRTAECRNTVRFEKTCVLQNELNYMMFGLGINLCGFTEPWMYLEVLKRYLKWRHEPEDSAWRKVRAAGYGYKVTGGGSGFAPGLGPAAFKCPGSCDGAGSPLGHADVNNWVWRGLRAATQ